jgi:hypothetical protein
LAPGVVAADGGKLAVTTDNQWDDINLANDLKRALYKAMCIDDDDDIPITKKFSEAIAEARRQSASELNFRKWLAHHFPPHQVFQILDHIR